MVQTMKSFTDKPATEYLWNAKPRFGKTLAVYDLCMRMNLHNVLVVTNRPAIADSWYNDYLKFVGPDHYLFVSRVSALLEREDPCLTRQQYVEAIKQPGRTKNCIEFVSLQDLKGSIHFGGSYDKLEEVANLTGPARHRRGPRRCGHLQDRCSIRPDQAPPHAPSERHPIQGPCQREV